VQGGKGIVVMVPSYFADRAQGTPAEREAALRGLGVAIYSDDQLAALARRAGTPLEVDTELRRTPIVDAEVVTERSTINSAWSARSVAEHDGRGPVLDLLPDLAPGEPHGWYLRISPASGASWLPNPLWPWLGVLTMGALVALACSLIQRTAKARQLADELTVANTALAGEVHERTEAERALKRQATLVSLSLETMDLVAWHFDCRTCELTRVSAAAPVTTQVLPESSWTATLSDGIPEQTRTGLFGGVPEEERARVVAYVQEVLARRESECRFEFQTRGDDGLPRYVAVIGRFARDAAGRLLSFTGLQLDVTERRQIEEERRVLDAHLQDTQRLESLGVLAGGVAHDFNNLIMGIVGGTAVLQERSPDDPITRRALGLIERGTTRAAELTRQLLVYAGREQTVVEPTALGAVVQDMLPLLETSAGKHVTLALTIEHDIPAVQADLTQLRQIIMNLVINAAEATSPAGGTVAVAVGSREYDRATLAAAWPANDLAGGRYVFLEVRDGGCGMSPQDAATHFRPVLHDQVHGPGARPRRRDRHRARPSRRHRGEQRAGTGRNLHGALSAGACGGARCRGCARAGAGVAGERNGAGGRRRGDRPRDHDGHARDDRLRCGRRRGRPGSARPGRVDGRGLHRHHPRLDDARPERSRGAWGATPARAHAARGADERLQRARRASGGRQRQLHGVSAEAVPADGPRDGAPPRDRARVASVSVRLGPPDRARADQPPSNRRV
jgi:signal transduction histidine kinase